MRYGVISRGVRGIGGLIPSDGVRGRAPEKQPFLQMPGKGNRCLALGRGGRSGQEDAYVSQRRRAQDDSAR